MIATNKRFIVMKVLLDINDEKVDFVMELLDSLTFVKAKPLTPYKAEVLEGLREAVEQVNLAKQGKVRLKSARQLLDEL
ncbi:MAG: hypothetical protein WA960_00825 [Tunicatimonas sp.]